MRSQEKQERAWVLRELRAAKRFPAWFTDEQICVAIGIDSISRPTQLPRRTTQMTMRFVDICSSCRVRSMLGCDWCWCGRETPVSVRAQIALLRTGQDRKILPRWLPDVALSRTYDVRRSTLASWEWDGPICVNCGHPHQSFCLACCLRQQ
jgi:hypothetical protein